jgi:hypothetical protein
MPEAISNLLHCNGIHNCTELANVLDISRTHAYSVFNADCSGTATTPVKLNAEQTLGSVRS